MRARWSCMTRRTGESRRIPWRVHAFSLRPWVKVGPSPDPVVLARQASLHHRLPSWLLPGATAKPPRKKGALVSTEVRHPILSRPQQEWAGLEGLFSLDQFSKILPHGPGGAAAPLAASCACLLFPNSRRRTLLATGAAALAGSIGQSFRELV